MARSERLPSRFTSRQRAEAVAAYFRQDGEPYHAAAVLVDQATFALQQGRWGDVPGLARDIVQASEEVDAAYMRQIGVRLRQQAIQGRRLAQEVG